MEELIEMRTKELEKIKILALVREGHLSQLAAGQKLGISDRQVRKLLKRIEAIGEQSIVSTKRGQPSNRCLSTSFKQKTMSIVTNYYADFGPKLAKEYLENQHQIRLSKETLRKWMIQSHLWIPRSNPEKKHLLRDRRRSFGELIQIDGSHHDWFEGRGPRCILIVFIDDATSAITSLHFAESESLSAYYGALKKHLATYGRPLTFYGDRCAVLAPRTQKSGKEITHFQQTLQELDCKLILALSPQAKGRVERANRTLQDRLVKELRLRKINTIEEANEMLNEYREKYNEIFSKKPVERVNAHRSLDGINLEQVLSVREMRTLLKDNVVQFENNFYEISAQEKNRLSRGTKVEIRKLMNGKMVALFKGHLVSMTLLAAVESPLLDGKQVLSWETKKGYKPPVTHPYKQSYSKGRRENMQGVMV